jgi:hypothetical protein
LAGVANIGETARFRLIAATETHKTSILFGAIAQLGERVNGIHEVGGSIPPGSTKIPQKRAYSLSKLALKRELFLVGFRRSGPSAGCGFHSTSALMLNCPRALS